MIHPFDKYDDRERYPEGPPDEWEPFPQSPPEEKRLNEKYRRNAPVSDEDAWYTGGGLG